MAFKKCEICGEYIILVTPKHVCKNAWSTLVIHDGEAFNPDEYDTEDEKTIYEDTAEEAAQIRHRDYCSHWGEYYDGQVLVWPAIKTAHEGILFDVTIEHEPVYTTKVHKGKDDD